MNTEYIIVFLILFILQANKLVNSTAIFYDINFLLIGSSAIILLNYLFWGKNKNKITLNVALYRFVRGFILIVFSSINYINTHTSRPNNKLIVEKPFFVYLFEFIWNIDCV